MPVVTKPKESSTTMSQIAISRSRGFSEHRIPPVLIYILNGRKLESQKCLFWPQLHTYRNIKKTTKLNPIEAPWERWECKHQMTELALSGQTRRPQQLTSELPRLPLVDLSALRGMYPDSLSKATDSPLKVCETENKAVSYTHLTLPTKRIV